MKRSLLVPSPDSFAGRLCSALLGIVLGAASTLHSGPPGDYGDAPVGDVAAGIEAYPGVLARWTSMFQHPNSVTAPVQQLQGTWLGSGAGVCLGTVFPTVKFDSTQNPGAPDNDAQPVILIDVEGPNPIAEVRFDVTFDANQPARQEAFVNVFVDQNRDGQWKDGFYLGTPLAAWTPEWCVVNQRVTRPSGTNLTAEVIMRPIRLEAPHRDVWIRLLVSDAPLPPFTGGWPWDGTMPAGHGRLGEIEDHLLSFSPVYRPGTGTFVKSVWIAGGGGGGGAPGGKGPGGPCGGGEQYDVSHRFTLWPGGNQVPDVWGDFFCHGWLAEKRPDCKDTATAPLQGPLFESYGTNVLGPGLAVRNAIDGGAAAPVALGRHAIASPIPAPEYIGQESVLVNGCTGCSTANSEWAVRPFGAGGPISGTIRSWGQARAGRGPAETIAYAYSMTSISARGASLRKGRLGWEPIVRDIVAGGARQQRDPVDYVVTDKATGTQHRGTLLSIDMAVLPNSRGGGFTWENDVLTVQASDMDFDLSLPGALTSAAGEFHIQVRGGVVASAWATGAYAGMAPRSGTATPLKVVLPNRIEFEYDLGSLLAPDADAEYELSLYGAGEARDRAAWEALAVSTAAKVSPSPSVVLAWPVRPALPSEPGWIVQWTADLGAPKWESVARIPQSADGWNRIELPASESMGFMRLVPMEAGPCALTVLGSPADIRIDGNPEVERTVSVHVETDSPSASYQWQRSTDSGGFEDLPGAVDATATLLLGPGDAGRRLRCRVVSGCTSVVTPPFEVIIPADPSISSELGLPVALRPVFDGYARLRLGNGMTHEGALRRVWPGSIGMQGEWGDVFGRLLDAGASN